MPIVRTPGGKLISCHRVCTDVAEARQLLPDYSQAAIMLIEGMVVIMDYGECGRILKRNWGTLAWKQPTK